MLKVDFQKKLDEIDLMLKFQLANEILAITGPSGSGKTTLLNCLAGIVHPDSGEISLNGIRFYKEGTKPMKIQQRRVGYLFQEYALFPHLSAEQNILYGMSRGQELSHITELTELLGIKALLPKYPHQISGGEKQRVALARALAAQPDLLLLDEPFSALDDETRSRCQYELVRIHELWKIPVIFVTHHQEEAKKLAGRIMRIEKGRMTEIDKAGLDQAAATGNHKLQHAENTWNSQERVAVNNTQKNF